MNTMRTWTLVGFVFVAAFLRLMPHPTNFSPLGALALFSGVYFVRPWMAALIPLSVLFLTDALLGFHSTMWATYLSFGLIILLGLTLRNHFHPSRLIFYSLIGSLIFFVLTNFAVWLNGGYGPTTSGLMACYVAALPFFDNSLLGDLFFNAVMFGTWAAIEARLPVKENNIIG